jgi:hypothetical protein
MQRNRPISGMHWNSHALSILQISPRRLGAKNRNQNRMKISSNSPIIGNAARG